MISLPFWLKGLLYLLFSLHVSGDRGCQPGRGFFATVAGRGFVPLHSRKLT